ncbi:hypothetical protein [Paenibacillus tengchongensis]|uniref:hypothetical protein n=1 Tax=Paenibacillus tengchongensis TaxID=2608684 RepID=UPI00124C9F30|nr:hypothetical protein [Paenibacillus tengchongensis]
MSVLTTNTLTRQPTDGLAAISQAVVKVTNNGPAKAVVYLTGLNNDGSSQTLFAQGLFEVDYQEVVSLTYNITQTYFQFNVVASQEQLRVQIFLVDAAGVWSPVRLQPIGVKRITSEFRDNMTVTAANFAAISFRRNPGVSVPEAVAAEIRPDGFEILASTPIRYMIVAGGTLNGSFVNFPTATTPIPANDTALQVNNTCTTVTGGRVITQGLGSGLSGAYQSVAVNLIAQMLLYDLQEEPVTLVISSLAGEDNIAAAFRITEEW